MSVTPADVQTFLGLSTIDTARAQMLIDDAITEAQTIVADLPVGYERVIRAAVGRVYLNAAAVSTETVGPFSVSRPVPSGQTLSTKERRTLLRLAGRGGAFSIDSTPDTAATDLVDPLRSPDIEDVEDIGLDLNVF